MVRGELLGLGGTLSRLDDGEKALFRIDANLISARGTVDVSSDEIERGRVSPSVMGEERSKGTIKRRGICGLLGMGAPGEEYDG